jgi:hypothetical protein
MQLKMDSDARVMAHSAALTLPAELQAAADAQPLEELIDMLRADVQEHPAEVQMLP